MGTIEIAIANLKRVFARYLTNAFDMFSGGGVADKGGILMGLGEIEKLNAHEERMLE